MRKFTSLLAAFVLIAASLAPAVADARDRRGHDYGRHYGHHRYYRDHDNGDAVAAGVVGLVLGLAIGSLASQPDEPQCTDNYRRCPAAPPSGAYGDPRYQDEGYYEEDQLEGGYDPRYDDPREAYERDYGMAPDDDRSYGERAPQCTHRERQWDRYARRYVMVDVPC